MIKLNVTNSKAIMAILLSGLAVVTNEYSQYIIENKSDKVDSSITKMGNNFSGNGYNSFFYNSKIKFIDVENNPNIVSNDENNHYTTGVCIKNYDIETGSSVKNIVYDICDSLGQHVTYLKTNNSPSFVKLNKGEYTLKQLYNNILYSPIDDAISFTVSDNNISNVEIENERAKSGIIVFNTDLTTGKNMNGVYVSIVNSDYNSYQFTSSIEPMCVRICPGDYKIYTSSEESNEEYEYSFTVTDNPKLQKIVFEYNKGKIKIK